MAFIYFWIWFFLRFLIFKLIRLFRTPKCSVKNFGIFILMSIVNINWDSIIIFTILNSNIDFNFSIMFNSWLTLNFNFIDNFFTKIIFTINMWNFDSPNAKIILDSAILFSFPVIKFSK